jgi:hypothetical protein
MIPAMRYVVEIVDNAGDTRCFVGELIRREANRLVMQRRGRELSLELSWISDWFAVDDDLTQH